MDSNEVRERAETSRLLSSLGAQLTCRRLRHLAEPFFGDMRTIICAVRRLFVRAPKADALLRQWFRWECQQVRFLERILDPLKQWKLSPMDLESRRRWEAYTSAKEVMLERTHIPEAPWVGSASGRQESSALELHHPSPRASALYRDTTRDSGLATTRAQVHKALSAGIDDRSKGVLVWSVQRRGFEADVGNPLCLLAPS